MSAWLRMRLSAVFAAVVVVLTAPMLHADEDDEVVPEQVVVKLRPGVDPLEFAARYQQWYPNPKQPIIDSIASRRLYLFRVHEGDEEEFVDEIIGDAAVEKAEPAYTGRDVAPDPGTQSIFLASTRDRFLLQPATTRINADAAHKHATGRGVLVAVIDSGLDPTHPELAGRIAAGGWNFIDNNADIRDIGDGLDNDDDGFIDEMVGHGTLVSGLVLRVAPDAMILPLRVLDSDGYTTTWRMIDALYAAMDRGARVINMSLGTTEPTFVVEDAVIEAALRSRVIIASAGNEGTSSPVRYPAGHSDRGVIAVAATDNQDVRAEFSNFGEHIVLCAPGYRVTSTIPGGGYGRADGTSLSAPLVAGAAALVIERNWTLLAPPVTTYLTLGADPIDHRNPGYKGLLGAGRLDALDSLLRVPPGPAIQINHLAR